MERIAKVLFGHPLIKGIFAALFGILGNTLSGAYIFDITRTKNGVQFIDWRASPNSWFFWILGSILLLMGLFGWGSARYETKVQKILTDADIQQVAIQELMEPLLDVAKKDIKEGKIRSIDDVRKMFSSKSRGANE